MRHTKGQPPARREALANSQHGANAQATNSRKRNLANGHAWVREQILPGRACSEHAAQVTARLTPPGQPEPEALGGAGTRLPMH